MIYKRGKTYWYKFMWSGKPVRESTRQGNDKVARQMEAAHRTSLAKGEVGIRERKPIPTLKQFCDSRVEPWAKATFESTTRKSWLWYRTGMRTLKLYKPLADSLLTDIRGELVSEFAVHRMKDDYKISTVNSSLRVLRRVLNLAVEWDVLEAAPKIKLLSGEHRRERVISRTEEARYLAAAPELLSSVAALLADTGMRPEECFRLQWESVTWANGRHGTLLVSHGKTAAARRILPMTPRVRNILEPRWKAAGKPIEGWIWPAATRSGHIEPSSLRKQHANTFETIAEQSDEHNTKPVRPFVLYTLRHTFLTRLGESGCDVWTLARIAGHSSISISSRYVHPSDDAVLAAMSRLGGHNSGHSEESTLPAEEMQRQITQ
jgi:integrase